MKTADTNAFTFPSAKEHLLIEKFKSKNTPHEHFDRCFDQVLRLASRTSTSGVVILTGPTGSGKTHLARKLYSQLKEQHCQTDKFEKDACIPIVGLRAVPPRAIAFDWQDFFIRLLEQLQDILTEKKLLVPIQLPLLGEFPVCSPAETMKVTTLRRCVEKALRFRQTRVLIVDEAHHILMCKDPDMQRFVFEQLKSLTDETGVILVLVGTYDLLDIRDYSGQLMRRSEIVHLQRYDYTDDTHLVNFHNAFLGLANQLSIPLKKGLITNSDVLDICYRKSAGCIGILRDLLLECLRRAVEEGKREIDLTLINSSTKSNLAVRTILQEAMIGEARLRDIDDDEIRNLLFTSPQVFLRENKKPVYPSTRQGKNKPGKRNPYRDPVNQG